MRVVAVIQARMGSRRLPGKVTALVEGRPLIAHVVERVKATQVDAVVGAIPVGDRLLGSIMREAGADEVIAGPRHDVLTRTWQSARFTNADAVMRVTGDCPLFAPDVANLVLRTFLSSDAPYVWNDTAATGWPDGTDVEVMTMAALNEAKHAHSASPADREHVTPWIRRTRGAGVVAAERDWSELKLSVDTAPDLDRVRAIMAHVPPGRWDLVDTVRAAKRAGMLNSPAGVGT